MLVQRASLHGRSGSVPFLQEVTMGRVKQHQRWGKLSICFVPPTKSSCLGHGGVVADGAEDVMVSEF